MARIRTIKPSFWGSDSIAEVSLEARLLAVGLVSMADDEGRFLASVNAISGYLFPHDEIPQAKLRRWLKELETVGFLQLYEVKKRHYGVVPKFTEHQRISHPQKSSLPTPTSVEGHQP